MDVENRLVTRVCAVACNVNVAGRCLNFTLAVDDIAVTVDQQQTVGGDLRPVPAIGVDEVKLFGAITLHRKVVADTLMEIEVGSKADGGGQVFAVGLDGFQMVCTVKHGKILKMRVLGTG